MQSVRTMKDSCATPIIRNNASFKMHYWNGSKGFGFAHALGDAHVENRQQFFVHANQWPAEAPLGPELNLTLTADVRAHDKGPSLHNITTVCWHASRATTTNTYERKAHQTMNTCDGNERKNSRFAEESARTSRQRPRYDDDQENGDETGTSAAMDSSEKSHDTTTHTRPSKDGDSSMHHSTLKNAIDTQGEKALRSTACTVVT